MDFLELISIRKSIVTLVKRLVNSEWKMASHILKVSIQEKVSDDISY